MSMMGCSAWKEAGRRAATTIEIGLTMSGSFVSSHTDGSTDTVTYSPIALSKTLTRETFDPADWYGSFFTKPATDHFAIAVPCCCWKCRFFMIPPHDFSVAVNDFAGILTGSINWTRVQIAGGGGGTTTTNGSIAVGAGFIIRTPPDAAAPDDINEHTVFCRNAGESGRIGQPISLYFGLNGTIKVPRDSFNSLFGPYATCTYTDSAGRNESNPLGVVGGMSGIDPFGLYPWIPVDSCEDEISADAQIVFNGSHSTGIWTDVVNNFTTAMTFDLS